MCGSEGKKDSCAGNWTGKNKNNTVNWQLESPSCKKIVDVCLEKKSKIVKNK